MAKLRCPKEEANRAAIIRDWAGTANLVRDTVVDEISNWHETGGMIISGKPYLQFLDISRMERTGESFVYDQGGEFVLVNLQGESPIALVNIDDSFGSNTRRTLNRLFEKIEAPNGRAVDRRLRSMAFWTDIAINISVNKNLIG